VCQTRGTVGFLGKRYRNSEKCDVTPFFQKPLTYEYAPGLRIPSLVKSWDTIEKPENPGQNPIPPKVLLPGSIREKTRFFLLTGQKWPFLAFFGGFRGGSKKGYFWPFSGGGGVPPPPGGSGGVPEGVPGGPGGSPRFWNFCGKIGNVPGGGSPGGQKTRHYNNVDSKVVPAIFEPRRANTFS
jgi:hypothetical protein